MDILRTLRAELLQLDPSVPAVARLLTAADKLETQGAITLGPTELGELRTDVDSLIQTGLLNPEKNEEHAKLIDQLRALSGGNAGTPRFSVVRLPPPSPLPSAITISASQLPVELLPSINEILFLQTLALEPGKVLPPGKSLLSAMSRSHTTPRPEGDVPTLKDRVEASVHKAFWDEAKLSLSSDQPGIQLARLRGLYNDIADAIATLLPSSHPLITTLRLPPSPTNAPLTSAALHLREVLLALRARCAPARDATIDALLAPLDEPTPDALVGAVHGTLQLADAMKDDLAQAVLGAMSEAELARVVRDEAQSAARAFVLEQWGRKAVQERWAAWAGGAPWVRRLVSALCANVPVSCPLPQNATPAANANTLPPPFFFLVPTLVRTQNLLQALVMTAALRALAGAQAGAFTARVWALLEAEAEADAEGGTKLAHLADEVVRARGGSGEEEARVRAAVDRTLQPDDPVYVLLQTRVAAAFVAEIGKVAEEEVAPVTMRSGKRMRLDVGAEAHRASREDEGLAVSVKGFEDPVLAKAVGECYKKVREAARWIAEEWEGVVDVKLQSTSE